MNHIILFVDYFTPHIWGIEQLFWDITKALLNQQYRVSIVTSRHSELLPEKESDKNLTIYRVWSSRQNFRRYSFIWGIRHREIIQSSTHIHTTTFTAAFPARILAYIYNKKISITIHEVYKEIRHILKWRRGIFYRLYEVVLIIRLIIIFDLKKRETKHLSYNRKKQTEYLLDVSEKKNE